MSQRASNRKGWGTRDTNTPVTPAELNTAIPFLQTWVPAGAMSGGAGTKTPIFQTKQIAAQQQAMFVAEFEASADQEAYFTLSHRDLPFFNYTDPLLKIYPVWFQDAGAKPSPDEFIYWEVGVGVALNGSSLDFSMEPTPAGQAEQSLVQGQWVHSGAGTTGDLAMDLPVANIFGDALVASDWNLLLFEIERFGNSGNDTFASSIYLIGCAMQYATDFNNDDVWPVPP